MASEGHGQLPLDALHLETMSSGHLCLDLSERVRWEDFDAYAEQLLLRIGGAKGDVVESVEMKLWFVTIRGCILRLVYSDYPALVSLESRDELGDEMLQQIKALLEAC